MSTVTSDSTAGLSPIRTHGKFTDAAYAAIRTGIRMGRIQPGSRLHEAELAVQLGTSKTPVREALGRLVADGLATTTAGGKSAVYVTRLSDEEVVDLYEAREIIEPPLARMAAEKASESQIAALRELLDAFEASLRADDVYSLMELDSQLHEMIASIAGSRALGQARERLDNSIAIARVTSVQTARYRTSSLALKEHTGLCDAIAAHDSKAAERCMAEHIRRRRDDLIRQLSTPTKEGGVRADG
jgi:DNA-binding GntR family transcriptional regulator